MKTIFRYILFLALYSCCNTVSAYTSLLWEIMQELITIEAPPLPHR